MRKNVRVPHFTVYRIIVIMIIGASFILGATTIGTPWSLLLIPLMVIAGLIMSLTGVVSVSIEFKGTNEGSTPRRHTW